MYRVALLVAVSLFATLPAKAQSWVPWHQSPVVGFDDDPPPTTRKKSNRKSKTRKTSQRRTQPQNVTGFLGFSFSDDDDDDDDDGPRPSRDRGMQRQQASPRVAQGGPRPDVSPRSPQVVKYRSSEKPGTIIIDSRARRLYLIRSSGLAYMYPVSVGREGFAWSGQERISRIQNWPDWHPPAEMRRRDPRLPVKMTGGLYNPLGAKALYLGNSLYRIHGTSNASSIGRAASSGCFRMHNYHVVDLARRVGVGTKVVVINAPSRTDKTASNR
ncbi:MAG: L,D-transpeptidase [Hyphomicrobiaceae bacterium]